MKFEKNQTVRSVLHYAVKSILSGLGLFYKFEDFDRPNNLVFMDTASKLLSMTYIITIVSIQTILNTLG
jgi:hypothetical protein